MLDFGLAKLSGGRADARGATSPTLYEPCTGERAGNDRRHRRLHVAGAGDGRDSVDARSDIFSFGAMLYEMVDGLARVSGASAAETLMP